MVDSSIEIQRPDAGTASMHPSLEPPKGPKKKRSWNRVGIISLLLIVAVMASACAPTGVTTFVPEADSGLCNIYVLVVEWLRIAAGFLSVIAIAYLGLSRVAASILPDIGVRTGTVVMGLIAGLLLAGFGEGMAQGLQYSFMGTYIDCSANNTGPLGTLGL